LVYMEIMATDVMFQHFNGSGWSEAEFINDSSAGDQWLPQVSLVDGVVHVTYSDMGIGKHKRGFIEDGPPLSDVKRLGSYWMDPAGTDLQWTLSDDFGIASISVEYRHSTDNETWTDWSEIMFEDGESGTTASGSFSFEPADGDGFYELRTIGTDIWGNVEPAPAEAEARAGLDTTAPTGAFGPVEGWTLDPTVNLDLTVSDATSGVVKMRVTDNTLWADQPWVDVAPTVEVTLYAQSSGNKTVMGQVMDASGLVSDTFKVIVPLDVTKPMCEVNIVSMDSYSTGRSTVPTSTVELRLYHWELEEGAGVTSMRLSNDGVWDSEEWTELADNVTWSLVPGEGSRTVHLQVVDGVGHLSVVGTDTVEVDMSDPFVHMTIPDDDDTNVALDIMIVINFSEEMSVEDTQSAFSLTWEDDEGTVHEVVGTDTWHLELRSYRFSPDEPLRESTTYRIVVGVGAKDFTGNGLYPSLDNTFTTIGGTGNGNGDGDGDEGGISGLVVTLIVIVVILVAVIGFLMMRKGGETA
ncbi:MAG: Ig-like domain-containing protein, partial [Thermoplasmata archaeon]|nr:Ig-like domain-containing protein [Thermoplasmata archaeon]